MNKYFDSLVVLVAMAWLGSYIAAVVFTSMPAAIVFCGITYFVLNAEIDE